MFYYLFQPLIFIYCARLISFQSNCLDQIWFLTCNQWRSSFWNLTIFLEPFSIINFSFFCYRQFLMIHRIFLCASNCGLLVFFSLFGSFLFLACQIMHGTDLNFIFYIRHLFLFICAKFSWSAIFRHHFSLSFFLFAQQMFMSHCSWWSCYTCYYFTMAVKSKVIISPKR